MFGSKKRKAIENAAAAVSQLVRLAGHFGGLPYGFWNDAYVLGFLTTIMALFAEMAYGKKPPPEELGFIIMAVYERLQPTAHMAISQGVAQFQKSKDADYFRAVENAFKTVAVTYGVDQLENDPDVRAAKQLAREMRGSLGVQSNTNAEVGGMLQHMLFQQVVQERLSAKAPNDESKI